MINRLKFTEVKIWEILQCILGSFLPSSSGRPLRDRFVLQKAESLGAHGNKTHSFQKALSPEVQNIQIQSVSCSVVFDSLSSQGLQPTRLFCQWDSKIPKCASNSKEGEVTGRAALLSLLLSLSDPFPLFPQNA